MDTVALIFNLKNSHLQEDTIQDCKDLGMDIARVYEEMNPDWLAHSLVHLKENYKKVAIVCEDDDLEKYGESLGIICSKLFEEYQLLRPVDPDELTGLAFREGMEKEATRIGLGQSLKSYFDLAVFLCFYLTQFTFDKKLKGEAEDLLNKLKIAFSKPNTNIPGDSDKVKYFVAKEKAYADMIQKHKLEGTWNLQVAKEAVTEYINKIKNCNDVATTKKLLTEIRDTDFNQNKIGIQVFIKMKEEGKLVDTTSTPVDANKADWLKYLECPQLDSDGFANIYLVPINLPMIQTVSKIKEVNPSIGRFIFVGNLKPDFKGNTQIGTLLTGNQCLELYKIWFGLNNDRKIVTAYNFSGKDETQGKGFTDELQTLVTRWQTSNLNVKIKLHYNTQLTTGLPWLKTLQLYDSISEVVADNKFDPFPESAFVAEMMKTLEQMLKDVSNTSLEERAKHTAFDFFELQAQTVLKEKEKHQESYKTKSLLDRIYEAAEEGEPQSEETTETSEQNQNQNQQEENKQDPNQNDEEAKKQAEQAKKWQQVQQWYQDNKGCRWVAKLLSVVYSNWKNQGVYKEKGIDDQSSLTDIMKYIREEDKELAKEFINQMGGGLALAVMDQIKKVQDANKDNKKAEENAKELIDDHKSMSEEAKMISRLGTHKNFSSLFGQKGELADDKAASKQLFDIIG